MQKIITILGILFFIFILFVIYFANTGSNTLLFNTIKSIPLGNKLGHLFLFGALTFLGVITTKYRSFYIYKFEVYFSVIFVITFVTLEELSQLFIASRTFDFFDLTADLIGIAIAIQFANSLKKRVLKTKH